MGPIAAHAICEAGDPLAESSSADASLGGELAGHLGAEGCDRRGAHGSPWDPR